MQLFQYSILYVPKKKSSDKTSKTDKAQVLVKVTDVLAEDAQQATILASRAIPEAYLDRLDEVQLAVRPF